MTRGLSIPLGSIASDRQRPKGAPGRPDQYCDGHLTITDTAVWYGAGGYLYRIDVDTNRIEATYAIAPGIIHVAVAFDSVWVANYERNLVQRLDVAP